MTLLNVTTMALFGALALAAPGEPSSARARAA